jgi:hypothetical protein
VASGFGSNLPFLQCVGIIKGAAMCFQELLKVLRERAIQTAVVHPNKLATFSSERPHQRQGYIFFSKGQMHLLLLLDVVSALSLQPSKL